MLTQPREFHAASLMDIRVFHGSRHYFSIREGTSGGFYQGYLQYIIEIIWNIIRQILWEVKCKLSKRLDLSYSVFNNFIQNNRSAFSWNMAYLVEKSHCILDCN